MDTGRRQHLQDIYSTDKTDRDDFTPQVSNEIIENRKREMRRRQFASFGLGLTVLVMAVALAGVVVWQYNRIKKMPETPMALSGEYVPRYSLPDELQWVFDYSSDYGDPTTWEGDGERPFNKEWIIKAAINIVQAQQSIQRGQTDKEALRTAAQKYEDTLTIFPDLEGIKVPLGMIYFNLQEYDKAIDVLAGIPEEQLTFEVLSNLGAACTRSKEYDRAEAYLQRALVLKPGFLPALRNLAELYEQQDRREEAIDAYLRYLDFQPTDTDTRYDFALYMIKTDNWQIAAEQLRMLTKDNPGELLFYQLLARAENNIGNFQAAIDAMRRSYQLSDPSRAIQWMSESEFNQLRNTDEFQNQMKDVYTEE